MKIILIKNNIENEEKIKIRENELRKEEINLFENKIKLLEAENQKQKLQSTIENKSLQFKILSLQHQISSYQLIENQRKNSSK